MSSAAATVACRVGWPSPAGSTDNGTGKLPRVLHSLLGIAVGLSFHHIDFTPGGGYLPEARMSLKIPYLGFVQTPTAERVIRRYMFTRTWGSMRKPGSPH